MARKSNSRATRWAEAVQKALEGLRDLEELRAEYEEWYDKLNEGLQQTPMGQKLEEVKDLDIQSAIDVAEEAEAADLPLGFGKD